MTEPFAEVGSNEPSLKPLGLPPNRFMQIAMRAAVQLLRLSWAVALSVLLALIVAVIISDQTAETTWPVESSLIYSRLPIDASAERLYAPPDLRTATTLVTSPRVLQKAIEDQNLDLTPRALAGMLEVEEPRGTQKINLKVSTATVEEGRAVLAAVVLAYQEHVADLRRRQVALSLRDMEDSLRRNSERLKVANEKLDRFSATHQVSDPELESQSLVSNIAAIEYRLESYEADEQSLRVQHKAMQQQLNDQQQAEVLKAESEAKEAAAAESLADNRRRQDRLNELIREERRVNEIRAKLEAKQAEFDRKAVLHERGYLSQQDFEAVLADLDSLKAQIDEGAKIQTWQAELERLDQLVVPKANRKQQSSPIIHQTVFKLVELQLGILAAEERQRHLRMTLADSRRRLNELKLFKSEQAGLLSELAAINDERTTLNTQVSALQAVHDLGPREFVVAQTPSAAMQVPNSNRKKVFAILFVGSTVTLVSPLLLLAILTSSRMSVRDYVEQLALPTLTPRRSLTESLFESPTADLTTAQNRSARTLALRTQQAMTGVGEPIAFCSANDDHRRDDADRLLHVAEYLAVTDETVLVVSLPGHDRAKEDPRDVGFFDFVDDERMRFEDVVQSIDARIDFVSGGHRHYERLFSQRANEFFTIAKQRYSIVLINGPGLEHGTDVEMLMRHCQGTFILFCEDDVASSACQQTLNCLQESGTPIFGVASRATGSRQPGVRLALPKMRHPKHAVKASHIPRPTGRRVGRRRTTRERGYRDDRASANADVGVDEMIDELIDHDPRDTRDTIDESPRPHHYGDKDD